MTSAGRPPHSDRASLPPEPGGDRAWLSFIAGAIAIGVAAAGVIGYGTWRMLTPPSDTAGGVSAVTGAVDPRIDAFIEVTRLTASLEPGATCANGIATTGSTPSAPRAGQR